MTSTRYNISSIKQLIDLNGKAVNFQLGFKAKSITNDVFDAIVVTQEMLDSNEPLNYQRAEGEISGNITNDNGSYNNYFLCLKSDKPMEVDVSLKINELPIQQQQPHKLPTPPPPIPPRQEVNENFVVAKRATKKPDYFTNYLIFGGVLLLLVIFGIYYYTKTSAPQPPVVVSPTASDLILKNVEDGFNNLGVKLNEVSSKVTDGLSDNLGRMQHNLTENIQELSERIIPPTEITSDIDGIKESIENIKSHLYNQQIKNAVPADVDMTIVNPNDILSRIKSLPKSSS